MHHRLLFAAVLAGLACAAPAQTPITVPNDPYFANLQPLPAPAPAGLVLQRGDRLAICGDSITEQKMYSRIMETYLTVCVPELKVTVRQYGWSGETAPGFLARMTNDCLRFKPAIATTCYGMNDHGYGPYKPEIGERYCKASRAIVEAFKGHGCRVILGSPGCVSHKDAALNLNLCTLRNLDIELAAAEKVGFADVFWPMLTAEFTAHERYATNYWIAGGDGIHPGWAGHLVMAYAFLKACGLDGDLGTITVDWPAGKAEAAGGHKVLAMKNGAVTIESRRYPFCATGATNLQESIRSGMTLVPFNRELNRLTLMVKNSPAAGCTVTWGPAYRSYTAAELARGVNLADDFEVNPFSEAFRKVDEAVAAKQSYETHQIKALFHGPEFQLDPGAVVALTEKVRTPLAKKIQAAFVPVTHTLQLAPR